VRNQREQLFSIYKQLKPEMFNFFVTKCYNVIFLTPQPFCIRRVFLRLLTFLNCTMLQLGFNTKKTNNTGDSTCSNLNLSASKTAVPKPVGDVTLATSTSYTHVWLKVQQQQVAIDGQFCTASALQGCRVMAGLCAQTSASSARDVKTKEFHCTECNAYI